MFPFKRMTAAGLAVSMALSISVCAAAPTPVYDESYYVNLDYYGVSRSSNIVKSFLLNGQNSITDYGSYESIENMSNYIEPCRSDEGVTFTFEDQTSSRFYFEAKTDEPLTNLPWSVSLSYKLNGVPTDPAALAGAKGLVEITLDLIPNQAAPEYFRNNLVLTAATTLDCDTIYSVEAPGAQVQTVGNFKAIAFMAMPGEECHFVTRLGSDSFEFGGFTFLMVPATLSQMEQIKDIKEAKDTLEDSANAISKSLDVILGTMGSLSGSLNATADGLAALEQGRKVISDGKGQIYANLDQSLLDLDNIGSAMKPTEGDIKAAKETLSQVKKDLSSINATTLSLKENIASTTKVLKGIKADTSNLEDLLDDFDDKMDGMTHNLNSLTSSLDQLKAQLRNVDDIGDTAINSQLVEVAKDVKLSVGEINGMLAFMAQKPAEQTMEDYLKEKGVEDAKIPLYTGIWDSRETLKKELAPVTTISGGLSSVASATANVVSQTSSVIKSMSDTYDYLDDHYQGLGSSLADDGVRLSDEGIKALEKLDTSISQLDALYQTLNAYEPKAQSALDTAATLANALTTGTLNAKTLFSNSEALLKQSGSFLDPGTAKTLNGAIESLRRTTKGLNQTGTIQHAKDTVKQTIDDKWDEYTGESSNLLLMDTSSVKPSLTSSRNASPETIQILMRSDEITLESSEEKEPVDESYVAEGTVFSRIGSIFHAIGSAISGIFS